MTPLAPRTEIRYGLVIGEHQRFINNHDKRVDRVIRPDRYDIDPETGCWNWNGSRNRLGYGDVGFRGTHMTAHRASWLEHRGDIPDGYHVDHLCHNPSCVNPDHLEPVTPAENTRRRRVNKLTHESVAEIRRRRADGETLKSLAEAFGVGYKYISVIVNNRAWK